MQYERVIAVVIDTQHATFYRPDGSSFLIAQGDARLKDLVEQAVSDIQRGGSAYLDFDGKTNPYHDFEQQTGGLVRLFRVAKKAVAGLFGSAPTRDSSPPVEPVAPGSYGTERLAKPEQPYDFRVIQDIIDQAQPVSAPDFQPEETSREQTMVVVVGDGAEARVIPGVERLKEHFNYSARLGSTIGMERFFARLATMVDQRAHSVDDLLRFLERGDLPIADDGSIIAYKILAWHNREEQTYHDCHTGRVIQKVGSFVCVDESLVDKNRRNECSNGLHIARRGYINTFGGDLVVMCKIAPEDVIVVPHGDPNKVRVCGYHIVAELSAEAFQTLKANKPMTTDPETAKLLSAVIRGEHVDRLEEVRITEQQGRGLKITPLKAQPVAESSKSELVETQAPIMHSAFDDPINSPEVINPKKIAQQVAESQQDLDMAPVSAPAPTPAPVKLSPRLANIVGLVATWLDTTDSMTVRIEAARELLKIRKIARQPWTKLGQPDLTDAELKTFINTALPQTEAKPQGTKETNMQAPAPAAPTSQPQTRVEKARELYTARRFRELWQLKKQARYSWTALGFTKHEEEMIKVNKPDWI